MSIIVAVRKGSETVLAADSQSNFGSTRFSSGNHRAIKIHQAGASYIGSTGWGIYENVLDDFIGRKKSFALTTKLGIFRFFLSLWKALHDDYSFVNDQCNEEDESPFGNLDASFLVVNKAGIFHVSSDMSVCQFEEYYAVGSAAEFSLGALHSLYHRDMDAGELARSAIETAKAFNIYCGGDIELRSVRLRGRAARGRRGSG